MSLEQVTDVISCTQQWFHSNTVIVLYQISSDVTVRHNSDVTVSKQQWCNFMHSSKVTVAHSSDVTVAHSSNVTLAHSSDVTIAHSSDVPVAHSSDVTVAHSRDVTVCRNSLHCCIFPPIYQVTWSLPNSIETKDCNSYVTITSDTLMTSE